MKLLDFVVPEAVDASLASTTRDKVLGSLAGQLGRAHGWDPSVIDEIVKSLIRREISGTTGFGKGVAVPHAKHVRVDRLTAAVGRSEHGLDFKALDGQPVYLVFLVLSPEGQNQQHLEAMNAIFSAIQLNDSFRRSLRQADTSEKMLTLLRSAGK